MEIPDAMVEYQTRQMLDEFAQRIQSQGISLDQYFQFTGLTEEKYMEEMKPRALQRKLTLRKRSRRWLTCTRWKLTRSKSC